MILNDIKARKSNSGTQSSVVAADLMTPQVPQVDMGGIATPVPSANEIKTSFDSADTVDNGPYSSVMKVIGPPPKEDDEVMQRRKNAERTIYAIADGISALGNIYQASKGAKVLPQQSSLSSAWAAREQQLRQQREADRERWLRAYERESERRRQERWREEDRDFRNKQYNDALAARAWQREHEENLARHNRQKDSEALRIKREAEIRKAELAEKTHDEKVRHNRAAELQGAQRINILRDKAGNSKMVEIWSDSAGRHYKIPASRMNDANIAQLHKATGADAYKIEGHPAYGKKVRKTRDEMMRDIADHMNNPNVVALLSALEDGRRATSQQPQKGNALANQYVYRWGDVSGDSRESLFGDDEDEDDDDLSNW